MKALRIIAAILLLTSTLAVLTDEQQSTNQGDTLPKMPVYLGLGYNIIQGNPLSNFVDTGFGHPIFKATYKLNQTTTDNRYLIPDYTTHRIVSSCSFATAVTEHRGTQSYKKSILDRISTKEGLATAVLEASFSKSKSYEIIEKNTIENKESITHATAECEAYYLSVDLFKNFYLEDSFEVAVNKSYHSNNWGTFIQEYGTHFVRDVTMGGRAVQEVSYTFQSVSKLNSMDIDISTAAKARFAMFFGDKSTDWDRYVEQVKYSQQVSNESSELYIGGHPPRDGDVRTWVENVMSNPMPVRYSVIELTELFDKIEIFSIRSNLAKVKKSFVTAITDYCHKLGCKKPIYDLPKPGPAQVELSATQAFGGGGGGPFEFKIINPLVDVKMFLVHAGAWVNIIQLMFSDGVKSTYSPAYGLDPGATALAQWAVPDQEFVSQIEYYRGDRSYIGGFNLITNKGHKSPFFGTAFGEYFMAMIPDGYRIIGIYGNSGSFVDNFGFIIGRTVYPGTEQYDQLQGQTVDVKTEDSRKVVKMNLLRVELA